MGFKGMQKELKNNTVIFAKRVAEGKYTYSCSACKATSVLSDFDACKAFVEKHKRCKKHEIPL
jgi:hypothetical protein